MTAIEQFTKASKGWRMVGAGIYLGLTVVFATVCASGCATPNARVKSDATLPAIAGTWSMDLSPEQDGSYLKEMVITPDLTKTKRGEPSLTFTGSVYGGSAFDNGLAAVREDGSVIFGMVSDEKGELGGPYYWVGGTTGDRSTLAGRVRSLSRGLIMEWRAVRSTP